MEKEKKEIGMEKLIRYLLESKGEEYKDEYYEWYRDIELEQNIDSLSELKPFIKWLLENNKIDRDIMEGKKFYYYLEKSENMHGDKNFSRCERLLMLLSISDTPIEDLISYLK